MVAPVLLQVVRHSGRDKSRRSMTMGDDTPGSLRVRLYILLLLGSIAGLCFTAVLIAMLPASLWRDAGRSGTADASGALAQSARPHKTKTPPGPPPGPGPSSKTVHAKALNEHACDDNEWQFVITQVSNEDKAPSSI